MSCWTVSPDWTRGFLGLKPNAPASVVFEVLGRLAADARLGRPATTSGGGKRTVTTGADSAGAAEPCRLRGLRGESIAPTATSES